MGNDILLSPIPVDQFTGLLTTIVRQELRTKREEELQEKLLSPEEVTKLFVPRISVATLNNYEKQGLVQKHYLGRLTFYKYSEILGALKTIKKYSRNHS